MIGRERSLGVVSSVFIALGAVQVVRLTVFAIDPSKTAAAVYPFDEFYVRHSCVSVYFEAGKLAKDRVPNLYDEKLYAGTLGRFNID